MTLEEAIKEVDGRSRNINLQWFVCEWNEGFCINSSSHMRRFPDTKYVYSTGDLNKSWKVVYSVKEKRFKHVIDEIHKG